MSNLDRKRIEFAELRLGRTAKKHILECLKNNWVTAGPKVAEFERRWSELCGYKHSVAVSSGTDACINACLALYPLGAKRGQNIVVPALSFIATSNAVRAAGFVPKFVDVKLETLNIDENQIEEAIDENTAAVMVVHTMGRPCEMDKIVEICKRKNVRLIEDCCEAHYAKYKGKIVGSFGDMACFSCYTGHILNTSEGGIVSTNDDEIAKILKSTRSHGRKDGELYFDHPIMGLNSKMTDLEASIGLESLDNFEKNFKIRHRHMQKINKLLKNYKHLIHISEQARGNVNCPHGISITFKPNLYSKLVGENAFEDFCGILQEKLDDADIHWKRNFGSIPTQHGAFSDLGYRLGEFPNAEWIGNNGIHIGCHRYMTNEDISRILSTLDNVLHDLEIEVDATINMTEGD